MAGRFDVGFGGGVGWGEVLRLRLGSPWCSQLNESPPAVTRLTVYRRSPHAELPCSRVITEKLAFDVGCPSGDVCEMARDQEISQNPDVKSAQMYFSLQVYAF